MSAQHNLLVAIGVLASLTGVVDEPTLRPTPADGHLQRCQRQIACHPVLAEGSHLFETCSGLACHKVLA